MAQHGNGYGTIDAGARRLGRLRQGLLHRHGGDDAFDARRRGGGRPRELDACAGRVRQAVPHAGLLPDLRPVPGARDRPRLAHLSRPQGRALRLFLPAVGHDPVRLQGARASRPSTARSASPGSMPRPSSSRSARSGSSTCCRSSSSSPSSTRGVPADRDLADRGRARDRADRDRLDRDRRVRRRASSISTPATCWRRASSRSPPACRRGRCWPRRCWPSWAVLNGVFVFGGLADLPFVSLALGADRRRRRGRGLGADGAERPVRGAALSRAELDRGLSGVLPRHGGLARACCCKTGLETRHGRAAGHRSRHRRRGRAVLARCAARRCASCSSGRPGRGSTPSRNTRCSRRNRRRSDSRCGQRRRTG